MDRELELELLRECLANTASREPPLGGAETQIPVSVYLDPARFAAERAAQRQALHLAGHASELPHAGSFVTREVAGIPVLIVRDNDRKVRAFINVCRHRGATLELREGGQCKAFVCPYHAWSYRLDGTLHHARHAAGFPSLEASPVKLAELTCHEYASFVWVCPTLGVDAELDKHARELANEIVSSTEGEVAVFATESEVWSANWKLLVEGGLESYHFRVAHRDTIAPLFTDTRSTFRQVGDHIRSVLPRSTIRSLPETAESEWNLLKHANVLYTFAPSASVLMQEGGHYALIRMTPLSIDQTRVDVSTVGRPVPEGESGDRIREFLSANHAFTVTTLKEDFRLAEQIQRGLSSGANEYLRFGRFEDALTAWHASLGST